MQLRLGNKRFQWESRTGLVLPGGWRSPGSGVSFPDPPVTANPPSAVLYVGFPATTTKHNVKTSDPVFHSFHLCTVLHKDVKTRADQVWSLPGLATCLQGMFMSLKELLSLSSVAAFFPAFSCPPSAFPGNNLVPVLVFSWLLKPVDVREKMRNRTYVILSFKHNSPTEPFSLPKQCEWNLSASIWFHQRLLNCELITPSNFGDFPKLISELVIFFFSLMSRLAFSHFIRYKNQERQSTSSLCVIKSQDNGKYFIAVRSTEGLGGS